jgi:nucleotide-binding universal stress UspA family protein
MAHPDSRKVVRLLETILDAAVVPVRGDENEIRAALDRLFPPDEAAGQVRILNFGGGGLADAIVDLLGGEMTSIESGRGTLDDLIAVASAGQYDLTVMSAPAPDQTADVLRRTATPVLIQRQPADQPVRLRRLLCVLRGRTPDEVLLDWFIRLAQAGPATITLLGIAPTDEQHGIGLADLLMPSHESGAHIESCVGRMIDARINGSLKLRQGNPIAQIIAEASEGSYDLIGVAFEAYGEFIGQMIAELERQHVAGQSSVFVARPASAS